MPRRLAPEESALWKKVAATVEPLRKPAASLEPKAPPTVRPPKPVPRSIAPPAVRAPSPSPLPPSRRTHAAATLDSHWDRRLRKGQVRPDSSIDLHGHSLASAQALLDTAIGHALQRGARVLLVVAGRMRPGADRLPQMHGGPRPRGAIRASLADWLAASPHADRIVALRAAHVSHGGAGAVYVILRRGREG